MLGLSPSTIILPESLAQPTQTLLDAYGALDGSTLPCSIIPLAPGMAVTWGPAPIRPQSMHLATSQHPVTCHEGPGILGLMLMLCRTGVQAGKQLLCEGIPNSAYSAVTGASLTVCMCGASRSLITVTQIVRCLQRNASCTVVVMCVRFLQHGHTNIKCSRLVHRHCAMRQRERLLRA